MNWKLIFKGLKNPEMSKKFWAVLGMLVVYRIMAQIPVPLAEPATLKQIIDNLLNASTPELLSFINVLSGGALSSLSIMLVGLGPYINASIIMQLLTRAIPKLEQLQTQEGEYGRRKINQYTRILSFPLAIIQSIGALYIIRQIAQTFSGLGDITANAPLEQWVLMVATLTGGAMIMMWLGELITENNIGNGISLLITVSVTSQLPIIVASLAESVIDNTASYSIFGWFSLPLNSQSLIISLVLLASVVLTTYFVVYLNEASRKLKVTYAKKVQGNRAYSDVSTVLPIKLIGAGVIPIIFAVAFLAVPQFLGQFLTTTSNPSWVELGGNLSIWFQNPTYETFQLGGYEPYIYPVTYFMLVILFTFFYTNITFNAKEISESLQRQGGFIGNFRPGVQTENYLSSTVNKLNLFGALGLGLLAVLPIISQVFIPLASQVAIGGTSILILVSVALETLRKMESQALMVTYDDYENSFNTNKVVKKTRKLFTKR